MGYAVLNFPNTITNVNLLQDIGNVITGTITSASSLAYCTTSTSTVVNTLAQNWTQVAYNTALTARGFSAPCVTGGKTKYVKLFASTTNDTSTYTSAAFSSTVTNQDSSPHISATACGSIASSTTVVTATNECSFTNYVTTVFANYLSKHYIGIGPGSIGQVVLSWSSRHLLIMGNNNSGAMFNFFCEYPENGASTYASYPPFLALKMSAINGNNFNDLSNNDSGASELRTPIYYNMRSGSTTSFYPQVLSAKVTQNIPLTGTIWLNNMSSMYTTGNSGTNYLLPLYFTYPHEGIPMTSLSALTNIYIGKAAMGSAGDSLTISADSFRIIPYGSNGTYGGATKCCFVVPYQ